MACSKSEYIRFEIVDFNAKALSKTVPARHKDKTVCMYSGALAMGANSEVLTFPTEVAEAGCPNNELIPDWSTLNTLPWAATETALVKRVYCSMRSVIGADAPESLVVPRTICQRKCEELQQEFKLQFKAGGELEFTLARLQDEKWEPAFTGVDIFATLQNNKAMEFCYEVEQKMLPVGVDIATINAEYGAGQIEITFEPRSGVEAADMTMTFRTGIKELAVQHGMRCSFMARPFGVKGVGNGGHFNFSLWEEDKSIMGTDSIGPSAAHFLAGVLLHAPAMEALCSPTPPCYTRHGNWAPVVANWGIEDRTACVRVKPGSHFELRLPSASANPYLVMAATIAAGIDGLRQKRELSKARQTKEDGALVLPTSLEDALKALEADTYMVEALGADFVRWYCGVKRAELSFMEERLSKTDRTDDDISAAWQHMYMEFV